MPKGYAKGRTKYVIVFGTVMSGLGKGIFSSSLAKVLQDRGIKVAPIKMEGYLNLDSGTLNPYRHGEVFVLDDGLECDMDLGTYERLLDLDLNKENYMTSGQIYSKVLERERHGEYLGRDVQVIPHVTGEIKLRLRNLAVRSGADVIFVEVGGTVGDLENAYYIEAMRELAFEEGAQNVCPVALTYVLEPGILGEQKSKAAQLGIKLLMECGIQPRIIACRCAHEVTEKVKQKISIFTNVPVENVISMHDRQSIYLIPQSFVESGMDERVMGMLGLSGRPAKNSKEWDAFIKGILEPRREVTIGITGKYTTVRDSYASIIKALEHAGAHSSAKVNMKWIDTTMIEDGEAEVADELCDVDGIIVPGGFGRRGAKGKVMCVTYARENNIPFLGICFGFQMAIVDFARNVCGMAEADSTELNPDTKEPVIDILPEQKSISSMGGNMRLGGHDIEIREGTLAHSLYGSRIARERFRHRYECNPEYIKALEKRGMVFSGKAPGRPIMQVLELPGHPYFIATQAHPCFRSRPLRPHPFFLGLVRAALKKGKE